MTDVSKMTPAELVASLSAHTPDPRVLASIVRVLAADPHARIIVRNHGATVANEALARHRYEFGCVLGAPPVGGAEDKRIKTSVVVSAEHLPTAFDQLADAVEARLAGLE